MPRTQGEQLTLRQLNRTLLQRQLLLERQELPVSEAVEHLVGMQAQVPGNPYEALWSRLVNFDPHDLGQMVAEGRAVRMCLMRGTLHLVTARDALAMWPVFEPVLRRLFMVGNPFWRQLPGIDLDALLAEGRRLVEDAPKTHAELRLALHPQWPHYPAEALAYAVHYGLPLVQVPPRGVWGKSGVSRLAMLESWLGKEIDGSADPDAIVLRYLAAFGPASVADVQSWSGMTGVAALADRLRPRLRTYRDEKGRELFDVETGVISDPDLPAPVRFLPEYDNVFLAHADRSRIGSEANKQRAMSGLGRTFLIDGFIEGTWKLERNGRDVTLKLQTFDPQPHAVIDELEAEATRFLEFMTPQATSRELDLLPPVSILDEPVIERQTDANV